MSSIYGLISGLSLYTSCMAGEAAHHSIGLIGMWLWGCWQQVSTQPLIVGSAPEIKCKISFRGYFIIFYFYLILNWSCYIKKKEKKSLTRILTKEESENFVQNTSLFNRSLLVNQHFQEPVIWGWLEEPAVENQGDGYSQMCHNAGFLMNRVT